MFKKIFLLFFIATPFAVFGIDSYTTLAPIADMKQVAINGGSGLSVYLNNIYILGISLCTGLAVLMIVIGGIEYMGSGSWSGKDEGKEKIKAALLGLLVALGSYVILNTLDTRFLNTDLNIEQATVEGVSAGDNFHNITKQGEAGTYSDGTGGIPSGKSSKDSIESLIKAGTTLPNKSWNDYLLQQINTSGLLGLTPSDASRYFPSGITAEGYQKLLSSVISKESGFNPNDVFYEKTMGKNSVGLFSLSYDDPEVQALGYSEQDLKDPYKNIQAGVQIFKNRVQTGGVISGKNSSGNWVGGTSYWSTLR